MRWDGTRWDVSVLSMITSFPLSPSALMSGPSLITVGPRLEYSNRPLDERVRFGAYSRCNATTADPTLMDNQALVSAPLVVSQYSVRNYGAMSGTMQWKIAVVLLQGLGYFA